MTYGPDASHFTAQMPRSPEPAMFHSLEEASHSSGSEESTTERKSRWPAWWPIARAHWPR